MSATKKRFKRLGPCLYRRKDAIFARVPVNGKLTWRSTGTDEPAEARQWLKKWRTEAWMLESGIEPPGVVLHRKRVTVGELIDMYIDAGCPTRKMQRKAASTLDREQRFFRIIRAYFEKTPAAALTLADCDKYKDWRQSGGFVSKFKGPAKKPLLRWNRNRAVDVELGVLANVINLAVRRGTLKSNPILDRGRYTSASEVVHCREKAPTAEGLQQIVHWLRLRKEHDIADVISFLAFSGLRINEALPLDWESVDWSNGVIHVKREKKGVFPWVPIASDMEHLLRDMKTRATSHLMFASPFDSEKPRNDSAIAHRLTAACRSLGIRHAAPHGLRSYFVTQARQSGLSEADIAMLIGDKSGPAILALAYGDVRPDHLMAQAKRIRLTTAHVSRGTGKEATQANSSMNGNEDASRFVPSSIAS